MRLFGAHGGGGDMCNPNNKVWKTIELHDILDSGCPKVWSEEKMWTYSDFRSQDGMDKEKVSDEFLL